MRNIIKRTILGIFFILLLPLIVLVKVGLKLGTEKFFLSVACGLSLIPGVIGSYIRLAFYKGILEECSSDVSIGFGSFFSRATSSVGKNVSIGAYCVIGSVDIGHNVLIASRVSIPSGRHQHGDSGVSHVPDMENQFERLSVGNNTWIGEAAVVLNDVGENCIIGAGSVVVKAVPDNSVAVGNPAKAKEKHLETTEAI